MNPAMTAAPAVHHIQSRQQLPKEPGDHRQGLRRAEQQIERRAQGELAPDENAGSRSLEANRTGQVGCSLQWPGRRRQLRSRGRASKPAQVQRLSAPRVETDPALGPTAPETRADLDAPPRHYFRQAVRLRLCPALPQRIARSPSRADRRLGLAAARMLSASTRDDKDLVSGRRHLFVELR